MFAGSWLINAIVMALSVSAIVSGVIYPECVGVESGKFVASKTNCAKYIFCDDEKSFEGECLADNYFNEQAGNCDDREAVVCNIAGEGERTQDSNANANTNTYDNNNHNNWDNTHSAYNNENEDVLNVAGNNIDLSSDIVAFISNYQNGVFTTDNNENNIGIISKKNNNNFPLIDSSTSSKNHLFSFANIGYNSNIDSKNGLIINNNQNDDNTIINSNTNSYAKKISTSSISDIIHFLPPPPTVASDRQLINIVNRTPQCPSRSGVLFLPSSESCAAFYACYDGIAIPMACAHRTYFDAERGKCEPQERVSCLLHKSVNVNCHKGVYEFMPHPHNCAYYYFCSDGFPMIFQCPVQYKWHFEQRTCVHESEAKCFAGVLPAKIATAK